MVNKGASAKILIRNQTKDTQNPSIVLLLINHTVWQFSDCHCLRHHDIAAESATAVWGSATSDAAGLTAI
jgi:hypothetical protein